MYVLQALREKYMDLWAAATVMLVVQIAANNIGKFAAIGLGVDDTGLIAAIATMVGAFAAFGGLALAPRRVARYDVSLVTFLGALSATGFYVVFLSSVSNDAVVVLATFVSGFAGIAVLVLLCVFSRVEREKTGAHYAGMFLVPIIGPIIGPSIVFVDEVVTRRSEVS